jgi:hypothetical protein
MSLILDALRKLERERNAREPGVLVVGSVPWGERRPSRRPLAVASLALVSLAFSGWWWWWRPTPRPATAAPASPSPAPSAGTARTPAAPTPSERLAPPSTPSAPPQRQLALPTRDETAGPPAPRERAPAATAARPAPDDLRLTAITRRDGRPVALVNDRLVFEGDSFDGVRILRIGEDEVEVEVRGQRRVLRF